MIFTAENIREYEKKQTEKYSNNVVKRAKKAILYQLKENAEGRGKNKYVSVYGNITQEAIDYFASRGFKVTVFYKGDGMFVSWEE